MKPTRLFARSGGSSSVVVPRSPQARPHPHPPSSQLPSTLLQTRTYTRTRILVPSASKTKTARPQHLIQPISAAGFSSTHRVLKGLLPDSADPAPPNTEPTHSNGSGSGAAQISDAEYHEIADQYLDSVLFAAEDLSERSEDGLDVEYSAGVLTISQPSKGSYVINKQPPNKQIWLSSPVSGPKRYDWVVSGAGQHEKEGSTVDAGDDGAGGKWIYLRDGTSLSDLLKKEIGVEVSKDGEADVTGGREGPGASGAVGLE